MEGCYCYYCVDLAVVWCDLCVFFFDCSGHLAVISLEVTLKFISTPRSNFYSQSGEGMATIDYFSTKTGIWFRCWPQTKIFLLNRFLSPPCWIFGPFLVQQAVQTQGNQWFSKSPKVAKTAFFRPRCPFWPDFDPKPKSVFKIGVWAPWWGMASFWLSIPLRPRSFTWWVLQLLPNLLEMVIFALFIITTIVLIGLMCGAACVSFWSKRNGQFHNTPQFLKLKMVPFVFKHFRRTRLLHQSFAQTKRPSL